MLSILDLKLFVCQIVELYSKPYVDILTITYYYFYIKIIVRDNVRLVIFHKNLY